MAETSITASPALSLLKSWLREDTHKRMASIDVTADCASCRLYDLAVATRKGFAAIGVGVDADEAITRALGAVR